jgi:DNA-binding GntR family transcriptional regulator
MADLQFIRHPGAAMDLDGVLADEAASFADESLAADAVLLCSIRFPGRLGTSFAEHESVVRAILDRNPNEAQTLLRSHVIVQGDRFADLIASIRQLGRRADDPISKPQ